MESFDVFLQFKTDNIVDDASDLSSAIRGLWGRALKKTYCNQKQLNCQECGFANCTYFVLFEKQLSSAEQYHPYIIQARAMKPDMVQARFRFFGWICQHHEKLMFSLLKLDNATLMREGRSCKLLLERIFDANNHTLYQTEGMQIHHPKIRQLHYRPQAEPILELILKTPLRQKHQGKLMDHFVWDSFAKSLINRLRFVDTHYNHGNLQIPEYISIDGVKILSDATRWSEKIRKSFRQEATMSIGGLIGTVTLQGVSPEMIGVLKLARYLHAGKQCTFGNGEISLKKMSDA